MWGLTINGKHAGTDWGLGCTSCTLTAPEPRTYSIDIPGADGDVTVCGKDRYKCA